MVLFTGSRSKKRIWPTKNFVEIANYCQKKFGWTIVVFEQNKIGNTNKYERIETDIISPGININSDTYSNIL